MKNRFLISNTIYKSWSPSLAQTLQEVGKERVVWLGSGREVAVQTFDLGIPVTKIATITFSRKRKCSFGADESCIVWSAHSYQAKILHDLYAMTHVFGALMST